MNKNFKTALGACILLAVVLGGRSVEAQTLASLPMAASTAVVTGEARPLLAWVDFCQREPRECAVDAAEPATISLTPRSWQTIVSVNRKVNTEIVAVTDLEHWGVPDRWDLPTDGYGDCEDFQLLKRKLLAESGLPRRAMRMTVVIDEKREGHAVLMIRTDRGDFILDNKTNAVLPWQQTGYIYVKRESQHGLGWASLGGGAFPVVTANR
jgi:predicted transglutaminase-like cysteine proteinase